MYTRGVRYARGQYDLAAFVGTSSRFREHARMPVVEGTWADICWYVCTFLFSCGVRFMIWFDCMF